jgi:hypothetical protein
MVIIPLVMDSDLAFISSQCSTFDSMFGIMVVVGTILSLNLYKFEFSGSSKFDHKLTT